MSSPRELVVRAGKSAILWLRDDRRLERLLARLPVDGPRSRFSHRLVAPTATLSPWYDDQAFMTTYEAIAENTLVDIYRCWDLWLAVGQVAAMDGDILEVGVYRGGTGALLAERARALDLDAEVILADTFEGVVGAGAEDPWYRGGEHEDTSTEVVSELLRRFPGTRTTFAVGRFPTETSEPFEERSLRLVHIDVDVYDSARDTLAWAWPRLGVGGMVIFDDYGFYECEGVAALGAQLMAAAGSALRCTTNLDGHLTVVKVADEPFPLG